MAFGSDTEKTEQPTSRRLDEARNKGSVAFSPDLNSAASLLVGFVLLYALGVNTYNSLHKTMQSSLGGLVGKDITTDSLVTITMDHVYVLIKILSPFLGDYS